MSKKIAIYARVRASTQTCENQFTELLTVEESMIKAAD
jgi:hypothetical protein